ncbi:TetR/AcrR family transcriptional regulator [Streptomyces sp. 135]|uniref:TetR/AcrR family transcriptional regulator n=1 Tax=Streptomyces sp. 135 TaxID=2838850 RepID=UPI001CBBDB5D|nr:TetR/AcrR family transcriptional regulator [Streptomyces sp. 135]
MARDTGKTKRLLMDAARAEFAEYGIAGARVNRIAEQAGVNKERIYGHFGNKEGLFNAVLGEAMAELAQAVRPGEGPAGEYVGRVFDYHSQDPTLLRLLMFEALYYGDRLADRESSRAAWYASASESLRDSTGYTSEQAAQLLLTLIGLGAWPVAMPQLARLALDKQEDCTGARGSLRDFLVAFTERAMAGTDTTGTTSTGAEVGS